MEIIRITVLRVAASRKICLKSICRGTYCNFRLASSAPSRTSQKIRNSKRENAWTRQDVDYSAHASRKIENLFNRRDRATLKCAKRRFGFFSFPFRFNIWDISFRRRTRFQPDPFPYEFCGSSLFSPNERKLYKFYHFKSTNNAEISYSCH